jgi:ABC-2 type transport system ATP-binding protein
MNSRAANAVAIAASRVTHRYGRTRVLHDVNLDVPHGATCALLGANGAGKTTLLRLLAGIEEVQDGRVALFGADVDDLTLRQRQQVAYVAEGQELPGWMTVAQLESYCAPLYPAWDTALATRLRERFALDRQQRVSRLSRGQRMQASLLCALAARPRILLMDEPFTGLDVAVKDELVGGLLEASADVACTTLVCTHDIGEIESFVDHVAFLREQQIALSGSMEAMQARWQRVEATLPTDVKVDRWPPAWTRVEQAGRRLSAVVDRSAPVNESADPLSQSTDVQWRALSLRELYLAFGATNRPVASHREMVS